MKVAFYTLGCKVNHYETAAMAELFEAAGHQVVGFSEPADVYVVNTCTVTAVADQKSRQMLNRARRRNPEAVVVAAGCYVQADRERVLTDTGADLVIGNDEKGRLPELLARRESAVRDIAASRGYEELFLTAQTGHTRAFLKVQDGCNQFCSYCLIPYVRGRVRSRSADAAVEEARRLSENGFSEIVLTGIHLSSYGTEDGTPWGPPLLNLIRRIDALPKVRRIRLGSLEPRLITREFVSALAQTGKVCPHFHLSLQSGCDRTLAAMNRHYTADRYRESVDLLREAYDGPALCTDVIVGFPGETDEDFSVTHAYLRELSLYELHVFPYSRREGTRAAKLPDQVPEAVKQARSRVLLELTAAQAEQFRAEARRKPREVLLEEREERDGRAVYTGYTREYVRETVEAEGHAAGEIVLLGPSAGAER